MKNIAWYLGLPLLVLGVGWLLARAVGLSSMAEARQRDSDLDILARVPLADARARSVALLGDARLFRAVQAGTPYVGEYLLAPYIQHLLDSYEVIDMPSPPWARIARDAVALSTIQPGFVRVGFIGEGTDMLGEICIKPGLEQIYELYQAEEVGLARPHLSVFHWLLAVAEEAKPGCVLGDRP